MKVKKWLLFALLGIVWGTSFLWIKIAVTDISPFLLVSFRALFAVVGLGVYLLLIRSARGAWGQVRKQLWVYITLGLINIVLPWSLISWGSQFIQSGLTAILNSTMPLFTILLSSLLVSDDRFTLPKAVGLLIGFVGVIFLLYPTINGALKSHLVGQVAILLAALLYGASTVFTRIKARGLPPQTQAFLQFFMATVMMWAFTLTTQRPLQLPQQPITWLALVWLGLLSSALAYIIYFDLLPRLGPTRMSMVTYILPLVRVLLGIVFLDERFHWGAIIGGLLILLGFIIVNKTPAPQK